MASRCTWAFAFILITSFVSPFGAFAQSNAVAEDAFRIHDGHVLRGTRTGYEVNVASVRECAQKCLDNAQCDQFFYFKPSAPKYAKQCYFLTAKSVVGSQQPGAVSGTLLPTHDQMLAYSGFNKQMGGYPTASDDLGNLLQSVSANTPEMCAGACVNESSRSCVAFSLTGSSCNLWDSRAFDGQRQANTLYGTAKSIRLMAQGRTPKPRQKTSRAPDPKALKDLYCTTEQVSISQSFNKNFIGDLEAVQEVMYPGAVFFLDDVLNGNFTPVYDDSMQDYRIFVRFNDRSAGTEPAGGDWASLESAAVRDSRLTLPDATSVNSAISGIVRGLTTNQNISSAFDTHQIHSQDHLNVALKGAASYNGFDMAANFGMDRTSSSTTHMGQLFQRYYSVSVNNDVGNGVESWFADDVVIRRLKAEQAKKGPLVYISSVIYGRAIYFMTTTEKSGLEVEAALHAAVDYASGSAEVDASTEYSKTFDETKVHYIAIGNKGHEVAQSFEDFVSIVRNESGADFSTALGAPIGYVLRAVEDRSVISANVNTSYPKRVCRRANNKVYFDIKGVSVVDADDEGLDDSIELYAKITAMAVYNKGDENAQTVASTGWSDLVIGEQIAGGYVYLGNTGDTVRINKRLEFFVPDDPRTETINEAHDATVVLTFPDIREVDAGSNADDKFQAYQPGQRGQISLPLRSFRTTTVEEANSLEKYPFIEFISSDGRIKIHYEMGME